MSKEYWVTIPIAGVIAVNITADSEDEAKEKAMTEEWHIDLISKNGNIELEEIDQYEELITGNVMHVPQWTIDVEEV
jgi:hypothetical protein